MRKMKTVIIMGLLFLSVLDVIASTEIETDRQEIKIKINCSELIINEKNEYITIDLSEKSTYLFETGKPEIPIICKTFTFKKGTVVNDVKVIFSNIEKQKLTKKIIPAAKPIPLNQNIKSSTLLKEDKTIYDSNELFPEYKWDKKIGYGLKNGDNAVFLTLQINPIQYLPSDDTIFFSKTIDIVIEYKQPENIKTSYDETYDLLIISPEKFIDCIQPLVEHKNEHNVKTIVQTTDDIYKNYNGRDDAEKIKLCIYDMKESYNISYVLLMGGRNKQDFSWHIPERLTNNNDGWEKGYSSDLYYSDIYKYNETSGEKEFENWDPDGDGNYSEFSRNSLSLEIIDHYPDVYLGRLACRYNYEVKIVVNKIIQYETGKSDPSWFNRMVLVAGDTFVPGINNDHSGIPEGELECDHAASFMEPIGFEIEKLYTTYGSLSGPNDVIKSLNNGAGFVMFAGHGNPSTWGNHPFESDNFTTGLNLKDMNKFRNKQKLPIIVVGGCHNSQFNVTLKNIPLHLKNSINEYIPREGYIKGIINGTINYFKERFWYREWVPKCWSWNLVSVRRGGSIATIGCTGLGYGDFGEKTLDHYGGWIDSRFFIVYANNTSQRLGDVHGQTITDYIDIIGGDNTHQLDRKTVEEWALLGDPSLKIGGYSIS